MCDLDRILSPWQVNVIPDFERDLIAATAEHKGGVVTLIKEEHATSADHDSNKQSTSRCSKAL